MKTILRIAAFAVMAVLLGCNNSPTGATEKHAVAAAPAPTHAPAGAPAATSASTVGPVAVVDTQPMSMGFKPAEFKERFNAIATKRNAGFRITNIQMKPSTDLADRWTYEFTNKVGFFAMVNRKDGDIRSFTYVGSGDGTVQSGANVMFALGMMVRAIDTSLTDSTANALTLKLMDAFTTNGGVEQTRNGIHYGALVLPQIGFMVAINPAQ